MGSLIAPDTRPAVGRLSLHGCDEERRLQFTRRRQQQPEQRSSRSCTRRPSPWAGEVRSSRPQYLKNIWAHARRERNSSVEYLYCLALLTRRAKPEHLRRKRPWIKT